MIIYSFSKTNKMYNQETKDKLVSLLNIANTTDNRDEGLSAIKEAKEICSDFATAIEEHGWDWDSLKDLDVMIEWVNNMPVQSVDELSAKEQRILDELRAYHKNSSIELDNVISDYFQMMRDKSKPTFDGNSFSLGFLECEFTIHCRFKNEKKAKRYLELLKLTGRSIDDYQYKRCLQDIKKNYPHLLNK